MLLFPSAVLLSCRVIYAEASGGSIPQMIRTSFSIATIKNARNYFSRPKIEMLSRLRAGGIPKRLMIMNGLVTAIYTIGVLAALLASTLSAEFSIA